MRRQDLAPGAVAPFFWLLTLVFAAAVLSRFDGFAAAVPAGFHAVMLWASFPLLLIAGAIEGRIAYAPSPAGFPLWMTIGSRPVRYAFTLGLTYLGLVALQIFEVSLGVIDPRAPEVWPPTQRLLWFLGFSFGMSFANYLAAAGALIPALRAITAPFSRLPWVVGLVLLMAIGLALGAGALEVAAHSAELRGWAVEMASKVWRRE